MAESQEVAIKLDDSFTGPVCDFSVGFLKFEKDGTGNPAGTGTFARLGAGRFGGVERPTRRNSMGQMVQRVRHG